MLSATDLHCREDTIIASTTSGFRVGGLVLALARPERFLMTHYWNPPTLILVVKVVPGRETLAIQAYLLPEPNRSTQPLPLIQEMADGGELGVKAGKCFYEWPAARAKQTAKAP